MKNGQTIVALDHNRCHCMTGECPLNFKHHTYLTAGLTFNAQDCIVSFNNGAKGMGGRETDRQRELIGDVGNGDSRGPVIQASEDPPKQATSRELNFPGLQLDRKSERATNVGRESAATLRGTTLRGRRHRRTPAGRATGNRDGKKENIRFREAPYERDTSTCS